jgi:hypothetical protein
LTENPSCVPDDSSKCKAGEIPESRAAGDNDASKKVRCGKEPQDKKQCDPATQHVVTQVREMSPGNFQALQYCKRTKKFEDAKQNKVKEVQPKKLATWNSPESKDARQKRRDEEERVRKEQERVRKESADKEEADRKDRNEKRSRYMKKTRMGSCLPLAAFMEIGMSEIGVKKRSITSPPALVERGGGIDENDMHEWSST